MQSIRVRYSDEIDNLDDFLYMSDPSILSSGVSSFQYICRVLEISLSFAGLTSRAKSSLISGILKMHTFFLRPAQLSSSDR